MATVPEHNAAFGELVSELRDAASADARALREHPDPAARQVLEQQLEHTLDRLAAAYGRGTYENLTTDEIVRAATENEVRLALELDEPEASAARRRASALTDAARRGVQLHPRPAPATLALYRGAYIEPLRDEVAQALWAEHEPFLRWRDGAVVIMSEDDLDRLRAAGDQVSILFLDADELLNLDGDAAEAELDRRLTAAAAAPDRVGDSREAYLLRLLDGQSIVLRNLRDRLAADHPSAHAALEPVLREHAALLGEHLAAAGRPPAAATGRPPAAAAVPALAAAIDHERNVQELIGRWAAEPDVAGLRGRFEAVAEAGSHLGDLEQLSR